MLELLCKVPPGSALTKFGFPGTRLYRITRRRSKLRAALIVSYHGSMLEVLQKLQWPCIRLASR
jgi:hypothetical protein